MKLFRPQRHTSTPADASPAPAYRFLTVAGAIVELHTTGKYGRWTCRGCDENLPDMVHVIGRAMRLANAHASECRALPREAS